MSKKDFINETLIEFAAGLILSLSVAFLAMFVIKYFTEGKTFMHWLIDFGLV